MEIVFSANNGEEIMVLPVVTQPPEIEEAQSNQVMETVDGFVNVIGHMELTVITIDSFFPVNKSYPWVAPGSNKDGWDYVWFFQKWRRRKVPLRIVITSHGQELRNMACTVDNFTYQTDRVGDIAYTLTVQEYPFVV